MAVTYGFYDSLNHDRLYNAQQMSAIFDGIINDGVFMSVGNQFHTVAGTGMQVIVKSGRAWFDSTWTLNDAEYPLSIDAADVLLTRIDAVVLEVNSEVATRANTIKVVKGTPASTPAKPTLINTATVHQHALAYVTVAKNITAITNSMIEIVVGKTETPYVTAILQTTDISDLFNKWENDFQTWFETVKGTLDGDVALNLQNQIDHCVKKADKATSADIEAGTADKWVDASSLESNTIKLGYIIQDFSDTLLKNNNYQLVTNKNVALKRSTYSKLFNLLGYRYGVDQSTVITINKNNSNYTSTGLGLYRTATFRVLIYNGHVYTYTFLTSNSEQSRGQVIMKDDTVVYYDMNSISSNVYMTYCIFVYNNRFYKIYANYNNHYITYEYWDPTTEQWTKSAPLYTNNNDADRSMENFCWLQSTTNHALVLQNGNIYLHTLNSRYAYGGSNPYRGLITLTASGTLTATALGQTISAMIYDNNKIYGINNTTKTYYIINNTSGETTPINVESIPNHVVKLLARGYSDIMPYYCNSNATEYIIGSGSAWNKSFFYVKYENDNLVPKVIEFNPSLFFTTSGSGSIYAAFHMLYDIYVTCVSYNTSYDPDLSTIDGDGLYMAFSMTPNSNYHMTTLSERITTLNKIYIPISISTSEGSSNVTITARLYDNEYFTIMPIHNLTHSYMKIQ